MKTLRQAVVNKNSIHVFEVDDVSAVFKVITHIDGANAGETVEGGNDLQAGFCCASQCQLGLGDLLSGSALVERAAADEVLCRQLGLGDLLSGSALVECATADEVLCHQLGVTGVIGLGNIELSLGQQHLSGGHLLSIAGVVFLCNIELSQGLLHLCGG